MPTRIPWYALALVLVVTATRASAQSCAAQDDQATRLRAQVSKVVSNPEPPWPTVRDSTRIPMMDASLVTFETKATVCKKAAEAYDREIQRLHGTPPTNRTIHLLKVGSSNYAASDPNYYVAGSEWGTVIFFTSNWSFVSAFTR